MGDKERTKRKVTTNESDIVKEPPVKKIRMQ